MYRVQENQLDAYLDRLVHTIEQIRQLDLSVEDNLEQAMDQSRSMLGTLAMYRSRLEQKERYTARSLRQAA